MHMKTVRRTFPAELLWRIPSSNVRSSSPPQRITPSDSPPPSLAFATLIGVGSTDRGQKTTLGQIKWSCSQLKQLHSLIKRKQKKNPTSQSFPTQSSKDKWQINEQWQSFPTQSSEDKWHIYEAREAIERPTTHESSHTKLRPLGWWHEKRRRSIVSLVLSSRLFKV